MSSQAPHQSPLERAKAEMDTLSQDFQKGLDNLRNAPLVEYETRINSLGSTFQASQKLAIKNVESAFNTSGQRIQELENDLRSEKALLQDAHKNLRTEKAGSQDTRKKLRAETALADKLKKELSIEKEIAKTKHDEMKAELITTRKEREVARSELQNARAELEQAKQGPAGLQKDLEAVKQRNSDLCNESVVAENRRQDLLAELAAVRQNEACLQAELKTARESVSTAEKGLNASQSSFNQFKAGLDALVGSYKEQLTQAQPALGPTPPSSQQDGLAERTDGPQRRTHHVQAQTLDSDPTNTMIDEADILLCQNVLTELMDQKHYQYNRLFLKPEGLPISEYIHRPTHSTDLNTMKEKLEKGSYTSASSFKEDFNLMIAFANRFSPHTRGYACEQLRAIFEEQWSAPRVPSHGSQDLASHDQQSRGHKRKASTERPVQSEGTEAIRRACSLPPLNNDSSKPPSRSSSSRLTARQTRSQQASETASSSVETAEGGWKGKVIVGSNIQVDAKVDAVIKRVSVVKPVNTFDASCKKLFPDKLEVQGHVTTSLVEEELHRLNFSPDLDMVTFRIEQALDAHNKDFEMLFDYFTRRERYGTASYAGGHSVRKVYLIPVEAGFQYPQYISSLDYTELPSNFKEKVLLMVVVFQIKEEAQEQIRLARDAAIKAVCSPDVKNLTGVRDHLRHHPLPILKAGAFALSGSERYMPMLNKIAHSRTPAGPKIPASPQGFYRLSYPNLDQGGQSSIDGVELPKCIFILGRVISPTKRWGLLVVDMENEDRPLWGIMSNKANDSRLGRVMMLMRSKFPSSLDEWESTITMDNQTAQLKKRLQLNGLKIERYRSSD